MAIYHLTTKIISRTKGSSVAAAAYRSGEKLNDVRAGIAHDYTKKHGVVYTAIFTPEDSDIWKAKHKQMTVPEWVKDREKLWNAAEAAEKRKDARTAREIEVALPSELDREQQIKLVKSFTLEAFASDGMVADIAIHDKGDGNPHAHIMLTTREVTPDGFGGKGKDSRSRIWNTEETLMKWRETWERNVNNALERAGKNERVDRRALEAQGIDKTPQIHAGHSQRRWKINEGIKLDNETREALKRELAELNIRYRGIEAMEAATSEPVGCAEMTETEAQQIIRNETERLKAEKLKEQNFDERVKKAVETAEEKLKTAQKKHQAIKDNEPEYSWWNKKKILEKHAEEIKKSLMEVEWLEKETPELVKNIERKAAEGRARIAQEAKSEALKQNPEAAEVIKRARNERSAKEAEREQRERERRAAERAAELAARQERGKGHGR